MGSEENKSNDFYAVLGLQKECTPSELRIAYKKLALQWHPDRFSASGNPKFVEEAKKKFQAIQQAYSVLSDSNKKFLYDVGIYDCNDDEDSNGMGEFLNEMVSMMSQTKPEDNANETIEDLQELFDELFQSDLEAFGGSTRSATSLTCSSSYPTSENEAYSVSSRRSSDVMQPGNLSGETSDFESFCLGTGGGTPGKSRGGESSRRKNPRMGRR